MAIISNGLDGASYLAVELRIDKRQEESRPFSRGGVVSWTPPPETPEVEDAWAELHEEIGFEMPDWPPIDKSKVGWLNCTIKFVVGANVIYQQGLLVQHYTFWEWYYTIRDLVKTEHEDEQIIWTGMESPELRFSLSREPFDPDLFGDEPPLDKYGYSLTAYVDTSIATGAGVRGEGPGMYLYPTTETILTFALQLLEEAERAG